MSSMLFHFAIAENRKESTHQRMDSQNWNVLEPDFKTAQTCLPEQPDRVDG